MFGVCFAVLSCALPLGLLPPDPGTRVGALFHEGRHYCTGTVVGRDLVITAAHCVTGRQDVRFAPQYRRGKAALGYWRVTEALYSPGWLRLRKDDLDIAFLRIAPQNGRHLGDVTDVARLAFGHGSAGPVTVIGYPIGRSGPVRRSGHATLFSTGQLRLAGPILRQGTSGSAWFNASGEIVAVLGGHLLGGTRPAVSYATVLREPARALFDRASR